MFIRFLSCVYGIANLELNCIDVAIFLVLSKDATPFSIPKFSKTFTHHFSFSSYRSLRYMQRKTPNSPRVYDTYIELVSSWWLGKKHQTRKMLLGKATYFYMMFQTFFIILCPQNPFTEVTTSADGQVLPGRVAAVFGYNTLLWKMIDLPCFTLE